MQIGLWITTQQEVVLGKCNKLVYKTESLYNCFVKAVEFVHVQNLKIAPNKEY